VFVIGYFGNDWRPPAKVLFEPDSLFGNFTPSGKARQDIAGTLDARTKGGGFPGTDGALNGHIQPTAGTLSASAGRQRGAGINPGMIIANTLTGKPYSDRPPHNLVGTWWDGSQTSQTLDRVLSKGQTMPEKNRFPAVLTYPYNQITSPVNRSNPEPGDPAGTLTKRDHSPLLIPGVRRLTPLECERLQGFPDNYTNIPGCSDTVRYQAIGNSMAVPVMKWIGNRIDKFEKGLL
jgi:DNA (cytosine-5)-methyltransferase 1